MTHGPDPIPLPPALTGRPFTAAEALDAGISPRRIRAADLDRSVRGVRHAARASEVLTDRCRMFAARLPADAYFSHATAALIYGAPLPWRIERETRLHITVSPPARAPHADGILGHRLKTFESDVAEFHGIRIASPERTWCDLATQLALGELVAVGDWMLQHRSPITSLERLADRATLFGRGRRGLGLLRVAYPLLDGRSESPKESELRVILALGGLPAPIINHVMVDTETGHEVRTDFAFKNLKFALEFQGDYHRTRSQWGKDMTRRTRLEAQGWYLMEINADDLKNPVELIARINAVLAGRGRAFA